MSLPLDDAFSACRDARYSRAAWPCALPERDGSTCCSRCANPVATEWEKLILRREQWKSENSYQPSGKGPSEWFTGTVRIDPLFTAPDPALVAGECYFLAGCEPPGTRILWANADRHCRMRVGTA